GHALRDVGPERRLAAARDVPREPDTPLLRACVGEPETAERNGHPCHVAELGEPPFGFPDGAEAVVVLPAPARRRPAIELHTTRVDFEDIGAPAIEKRVEQDADPIVVLEPLATRQ